MNPGGQKHFPFSLSQRYPPQSHRDWHPRPQRPSAHSVTNIKLLYLNNDTFCAVVTSHSRLTIAATVDGMTLFRVSPLTMADVFARRSPRTSKMRHYR